MGTSSTSMESCSTESRALWTKKWRNRKKRPKISVESSPRQNLCLLKLQLSTLMSFASNSTVNLPIFSSTSRLRWMWRVISAVRTMSYFKVVTKAPQSTLCTRSMWSSMCAVLVARALRLKFQGMLAHACSILSANSAMLHEHAKISRKDSMRLEEARDVLPDKSDKLASYPIGLKNLTYLSLKVS